MTWLENRIIDITTTHVFFFEPTKETIINKICDELNIDLFPSLDFKTYYLRNCKKWEQLELTESQKIQYDTNVFSTELLEKLQNAPSQLLFVFEQNTFKGILHFTDYGKKAIYETLFRNFFEFEKTLKQYLSSKQFGYDKFIEYYNYKANKETQGSNNRKEFEKKIDRINKLRDTSPNLDLFTLLELLLFSISDFHGGQLIEFNKKALLSNNTKKGSIDNLRNMVMHTRDTTGMTETLPHDFERFKELFFEPVLEFNRAFQTLQNKWDHEHFDKRKNDNAKLLDYLNTLDSNQLHHRFFDYDKYL